MNPKISILVPVYNVSAHIEKCAHSLFNQKLADIEYIFINDATPDDSMEKLYAVIAQYPEKKEKVKVIEHSVNRGLAAARSTALDAASGEYIAIVDSDDYIEPEMMEVLYGQAKKEDADIVVSDIIMEYKDKSVVVTDFVSENREERLRDIFADEVSQGYLWNKLIRRELYLKNDCRAPEGLNYLEDRHVTIRLYYYATKITRVNRAFYHYVCFNPNAITKTKSRMHFQNSVLFWELLEKFLLEKGIYEKYREGLTFPKVQNKCRLMCDTGSYRLRKEYAGMLTGEEKKYLNRFRPVERVMLLLVHYRMFGAACLLQKVLWVKNHSLSFLLHRLFPSVSL
ncbi:MAG: glycosyltransferase [Prevotellaceae bacterium]|jgi:glycosyltransferase involved in cell wall biosynthesis|nr:glycosyltransferase [Prevotellaceae bacterium]